MKQKLIQQQKKEFQGSYKSLSQENQLDLQEQLDQDSYQQSYENQIQQKSLQKQILQYVYDGKIEELYKTDIFSINLNFTEEFSQVPIDLQISPLILAAFLGKTDIVKLLLQNNQLDIDFSSETGRFTPLMVACMQGYYEIVQILCQMGADVNKHNVANQIPLLFCFSRLEEENNHFENKRICIKMVELLLDYGCDIDQIVNHEKQFTMLMIFCSVKYKLNQRETLVNYQIVKFLLQHGANKYLKSKKGKTCFELCEKHSNYREILKLLQNTVQTNFHSKECVKNNIKLITTSEQKQNYLKLIQNKQISTQCKTNDKNSKDVQESQCSIDLNQSQNFSKQANCCQIFSWFTSKCI
ncbi:Ankyrin repeat-containing domain [Pseudocohnilembus persalinus]|uniref:Ankyrin repeat-containing domain n=1 Tax=Pseudocohnilembus persalinus TaxID=266149 RepID=A0A0V0QE89_PSEPJ|nr:Ankyrin repeat-containing domain [Pseudocohnilembus persalinus]|eukprot:KRX00506.1 Ankyrin repeat-containing domain [Pseudocohnilembus persalinus]